MKTIEINGQMVLAKEVNHAFLFGYEAAQPKWIRVEDGLPPQRKEVCVFLKSGDNAVGYLNSKNLWTMSESGCIRMVIAWCDCIPPFESKTA